MKMKVSGLQNVELVGEVSGVRESEGYLTMTIRLTKPLGWHATAAMTHKDLINLVKLLLFNPANLSYFLFGFGKPGRCRAGDAKNSDEKH